MDVPFWATAIIIATNHCLTEEQTHYITEQTVDHLEGRDVVENHIKGFSRIGSADTRWLFDLSGCAPEPSARSDC
jgi:hypothetical protein